MAKTKKKNPKQQQKSKDQSHGIAASTAAKATVGVVAGAAAVGAASRVVIKRTRQPKVLGVKVPAGMTPGELDPRKLAKKATKRFSS